MNFTSCRLNKSPTLILKLAHVGGRRKSPRKLPAILLRVPHNISAYFNSDPGFAIGAMWEVRKSGFSQHDSYEMLTATESLATRDGGDMDTRTIASTNYHTESYQSTARIIVHALCGLTALFLIATCVTVGSSLASDRKQLFQTGQVMPSVALATGDCDTLKYANLILHLFINCVGTLIIGASNYLQQGIHSEVLS